MAHLTPFVIDQAPPEARDQRGRAQTDTVTEYGGRLFTLVADPDLEMCRIYSSGDDGVSWEEDDGGNRPNDGSAVAHSTIAEGQYLRVFYVFDGGTANDLRIKTFDMAARLWVAGEITGGPEMDHASNSLNPCDIVLLGDGSGGTPSGGYGSGLYGSGLYGVSTPSGPGGAEYLVSYVKYAEPAGTSNFLYYAYYSSGGWTLDQPVDSTMGGSGGTSYSQIGTVFVDSSGYRHFFYARGNTDYHKAFDLSWSPGSEQTIRVSPSISNVSRPVEFAGDLLYPVVILTNASNPSHGRPAIYSGQPGTLSPVWTLLDICPEEFNAPGWQGFSRLLVSGGTAYFAWTPQTVSPGLKIRNVMYRANDGSGWDASASTLHHFDVSPYEAPYDAPFEPESVYLHGLIAADNGHGFTGLVKVQVSDGVDFFQSLVYLGLGHVCCCADGAFLP